MKEMTTLRALVAAGVIVGTFGIAIAKLPAPPPMDDKAKAAAEEKKAKDAAAAEAFMTLRDMVVVLVLGRLARAIIRQSRGMLRMLRCATEKHEAMQGDRRKPAPMPLGSLARPRDFSRRAPLAC